MSTTAQTLINAVLYFEAAINTANGLVSLFSPALALQGMTSVDLSSGEHDLALEVSRWFGVMGLVFGGFLLLRVMHTPAALKPLLEALLIGDVLYLAALVPFTRRYGKWPMVSAPYALTLIMFMARLAYLLSTDWALLEARARKARRAAER